MEQCVNFLVADETVTAIYRTLDLQPVFLATKNALSIGKDQSFTNSHDYVRTVHLSSMELKRKFWLPPVKRGASPMR
jgi:hypothetical protein